MTAPLAWLDGVLLRAPGSRFGDRVFFCRNGQRHWVMDARWLADFGFRWPDDVQDVSPGIVEAFRPGRNAARRWSAAHRAHPRPNGVLELREIMLSGLSGSGLEFGAGANAMPVPLECDVRYADIFTMEQLQTHFYEGQVLEDLIAPDIIGSFESNELSAQSLDFIVASHVIEHTSDPIGAISRGVKALRPGGSIALAVPDMERTFDQPRPVTPLAHLIADFRDPSRDRDKENFQEFYRLAFPQDAAVYEAVWRSKWEEAFPIHYHCWTYESFKEMIDWIQDELHLFQTTWSHSARDLGDAIEFHWLLTVP